MKIRYQNLANMNFNKKDSIEVFENAISWIIVFAMFIYVGATILYCKRYLERNVSYHKEITIKSKQLKGHVQSKN